MCVELYLLIEYVIFMVMMVKEEIKVVLWVLIRVKIVNLMEVVVVIIYFLLVVDVLLWFESGQGGQGFDWGVGQGFDGVNLQVVRGGQGGQGFLEFLYYGDMFVVCCNGLLNFRIWKLFLFILVFFNFVLMLCCYEVDVFEVVEWLKFFDMVFFGDV